MVFQSHTRGHSANAQGERGFTLLEVMMVTLISSFVFAGVLSAYIFLGRGLSRQVNEEGLESRTRLALYYFTQDVSSASAITAQNPGAQVDGTLMTLSISGTSVAYVCNWDAGPTSGTLTRTVNGVTPGLLLLTNLTSFSFQYFDPTTSPVTAPSTAPATPQIDIKQVCMTYTSSAGYAPSGNQSNLTVVSPLVILKNKGLLQDPTHP
jgi:prepilin-type N-terminal cleavage/methylation domain-containing protein